MPPILHSDLADSPDLHLVAESKFQSLHSLRCTVFSSLRQGPQAYFSCWCSQLARPALEESVRLSPELSRMKKSERMECGHRFSVHQLLVSNHRLYGAT